jgi:hypothetical protein
MANNDAADGFKEMLLEAVSENPQKKVYFGIAKDTIRNSLSSWPKRHNG